MRLQLAAPLALGVLPYAPTLDSVLLGLLAGGTILTGNAGEELQEQLGDLVAVTDGVPAASCLWPDDDSTPHVRTDTYPRFASVDIVRYWCGGNYGLSVREDNLGEGNDTTRSGPFTAKMHQVRSLYAQQWTWWAVGDPEATAAALHGRLLSVGGQRGKGYGTVTAINIAPAGEHDWRTVGIDQITPGRPIPLAAADRTLQLGGVTLDELNPESYAIVPLPAWPAPTWGVGPFEATVVPILEVD